MNPFSDAAIKEILFDRRNIEPLGHLIELENVRNANIVVYAHELDCGPIPTLKEVKNQIFPEVKREVDEVLGFDGKLFVNIEFEGFLRKLFRKLIKSGEGYYDIEKGVMYIEETQVKNLFPILAHEYSHTIDDVFLGVENVNGRASMFCEGLASGVEHKAMNKLALKREDNLLRSDASSRKIHQLRAAYTILCRSLEVNPKEEIAYPKQFITANGFFESVVCNRLYHELGAAFLALSELKHGPSVYARALRRDEGILELH